MTRPSPRFARSRTRYGADAMRGTDSSACSDRSKKL
jgi:hypothetical protein